jgi:hypothetical protein
VRDFAVIKADTSFLDGVKRKVFFFSFFFLSFFSLISYKRFLSSYLSSTTARQTQSSVERNLVVQNKEYVLYRKFLIRFMK